MITVYWTNTRDLSVEITPAELLDAIAKSGQTVSPRQTDQEYIEQVMDEIDMDLVLPYLAGLPAVEILDETDSFDTWEETD